MFEDRVVLSPISVILACSFRPQLEIFNSFNVAVYCHSFQLTSAIFFPSLNKCVAQNLDEGYISRVAPPIICISSTCIDQHLGGFEEDSDSVIHLSVVDHIFQGQIKKGAWKGIPLS